MRQEVSVSGSSDKYRPSMSTTVSVVPGVAAIFDLQPVNNYSFCFVIMVRCMLADCDQYDLVLLLHRSYVRT